MPEMTDLYYSFSLVLSRVGGRTICQSVFFQCTRKVLHDVNAQIDHWVCICSMNHCHQFKPPSASTDKVCILHTVFEHNKLIVFIKLVKS